jgi:regulator of protease activity HflC (stomatin/prohibitin superfamily)
MSFQQKGSIDPALLLGSFAIIGAVAFALWGFPQLGVYNRTLAGKAALMEAESTRQVRVLEAKAKEEAAALEGRAEVTRAEASAKAISALKRELGSSEAYLKWLYIQGLQEQGNAQGEKTVVYIPTDGLVPLPISEAPRLK